MKARRQVKQVRSDETARLYFSDGRVDHFKNELFAFALWLALPKGIRVAFRGKGDNRPVYPWDYADVP